MKRLTIVLAALTLAGLVLGYWLLVADLPSPEALITRSSPDATKIYDRKGRLLFEVLDPRAGRRTRVPLDELPANVQQAVIAVEDVNFYSNPGVDVRGITRAALQMARQRRIVSGGSTITQQLARAVLLSQEERTQRTFSRKLRESVLALRITRAFSKDQILEMYLNEVYFGQLAYGVEAAAQTYFGKPARELDLAEAALLAGLIQSPAAYNPLVDIDAARRRQAVALDLMVKAGFVTPEEAELAKAEQLHLTGGNVPLRAPHFVTYVRNLLEAKYGAEQVNHGGLHVTTTLDLDLQARAEAIIRRRMAELNAHKPGKPDYNVSDAALVAIDPRTGEILAMVGSADYFNEKIDGAVNVALANRQPGSAVKPITYATA
ncbi:MAG: transglycosylase domain-containing protein, partial [Anaerolineae bacterium]